MNSIVPDWWCGIPFPLKAMETALTDFIINCPVLVEWKGDFRYQNSESLCYNLNINEPHLSSPNRLLQSKMYLVVFLFKKTGCLFKIPNYLCKKLLSWTSGMLIIKTPKIWTWVSYQNLIVQNLFQSHDVLLTELFGCETHRTSGSGY